MIKAQHIETAVPRRAHRVDVILRIDLEAARVGVDVSRPHGVHDGVAGAEKQPATLGRRRVARVSDDVVVGRTTEDDTALITHRASTAMAMPIPPPMHNAAIP